MARTIIPQIGKAVEVNEYKIILTNDDLEQKVVLGIQCTLDEGIFQLFRKIKSEEPLTFYCSARLEKLKDGDPLIVEYEEDLPYKAVYGDGCSVELIFLNVEQKKPAFLRTDSD